MARSLRRLLCCAAAAPLLAGCFFGNLNIHRDRDVASAPAPEWGRVSPVPAPPEVEAPAPTAAVATPVAVPAPTVAAPVETPPLPTVIRFDDDDYVPKPEFDAVLLAHAERLKADRSLRLLLKGHDDAQGGRYGQALAAKRAEMVAKALRTHGALEAQLAVIAMPSDAGDTAQIRRVDLIYR